MQQSPKDGLHALLLSEYGSSTMSLIDDYVRGNVSPLTLFAELGSSGMELAIEYKKACDNDRQKED